MFLNLGEILMKIKLSSLSSFIFILMISITHCGGETPSLLNRGEPILLNSTLSWNGKNIERLNEMMTNFGISNVNYNPQKKPIAVFDWDNTVIKNDIGDATLFWMINNDKILQPTEKNWRLTSRWLTEDANNALKSTCDMLAEPGTPLPTSGNNPTHKGCATEIANIYFNGQTTSQKKAFSNWDHTRMEPSYAWAAQLQGGYTINQIKDFVRAAKRENLTAPIGTKQSVGDLKDLNGYIRVYEQIRDLLSALQKNGFEIWVVSASPQVWVEVIAEEVNIPSDHVIGIRNILDQNGVFTYNFQGCADIPDGTNDGNGNSTGNSLITYMDGKRCWINKVIYGDNSANALQKNQDANLRPVFAAGDSDTDLTFLQDATNLKLVINRNKKALMCNAYDNADNRWIINPMFIEPKGEFRDGYPCSTNACKSSTGQGIPCLNEKGEKILDQKDTIFN